MNDNTRRRKEIIWLIILYTFDVTSIFVLFYLISLLALGQFFHIELEETKMKLLIWVLIYPIVNFFISRMVTRKWLHFFLGGSVMFVGFYVLYLFMRFF